MHRYICNVLRTVVQFRPDQYLLSVCWYLYQCDFNKKISRYLITKYYESSKICTWLLQFCDESRFLANINLLHKFELPKFFPRNMNSWLFMLELRTKCKLDLTLLTHKYYILYFTSSPGRSITYIYLQNCRTYADYL